MWSAEGIFARFVRKCFVGGSTEHNSRVCNVEEDAGGRYANGGGLQSCSTEIPQVHIVTRRLAFMEYPAGSSARTERVANMLNAKYGDKYVLLNLSERVYDKEAFDGQVWDVSFRGFPSPPLLLALHLCKELVQYLKRDQQHFAIVHCYRGYARTAAFLAMFIGYFSNRKPFDLLAKMCTQRLEPYFRMDYVLPSQQRYLHYFHLLLERIRREEKQGSVEFTSPTKQERTQVPRLLNTFCPDKANHLGRQTCASHSNNVGMESSSLSSDEAIAEDLRSAVYLCSLGLNFESLSSSDIASPVSYCLEIWSRRDWDDDSIEVSTKSSNKQLPSGTIEQEGLEEDAAAYKKSLPLGASTSTGTSVLRKSLLANRPTRLYPVSKKESGTWLLELTKPHLLTGDVLIRILRRESDEHPWEAEFRVALHTMFLQSRSSLILDRTEVDIHPRVLEKSSHSSSSASKTTSSCASCSRGSTRRTTTTFEHDSVNQSGTTRARISAMILPSCHQQQQHKQAQEVDQSMTPCPPPRPVLASLSLTFTASEPSIGSASWHHAALSDDSDLELVDHSDLEDLFFDIDDETENTSREVDRSCAASSGREEDGTSSTVGGFWKAAADNEDASFFVFQDVDTSSTSQKNGRGTGLDSCRCYAELLNQSNKRAQELLLQPHLQSQKTIFSDCLQHDSSDGILHHADQVQFDSSALWPSWSFPSDAGGHGDGRSLGRSFAETVGAPTRGRSTWTVGKGNDFVISAGRPSPSAPTTARSNHTQASPTTARPLLLSTPFCTSSSSAPSAIPASSCAGGAGGGLRKNLISTTKKSYNSTAPSSAALDHESNAFQSASFCLSGSSELPSSCLVGDVPSGTARMRMTDFLFPSSKTADTLVEPSPLLLPFRRISSPERKRPVFNPSTASEPPKPLFYPIFTS
ncbi:unnamed protein product [Amoebophrya sp. A25]|nr:unnamed protein product [Amoebophrya sp. A25]|eukprot:GSA25T00007720001.1